MTNAEIIERLKERLAPSILAIEEFRGDLTVVVAREDIVRVSEFVKTDSRLGFGLIIDVFGVDMYRPGDRFEVIYNVYSLSGRRYLRLKVRVPEDPPEVPTVTGVWPGANWHERETWDMFGIRFTGHPDLRRMYMPEGFEHFPLRKDFPLMGIPDSLPLPRR